MVLIWFASLLTIFIGMAGFGVDVWNWWQTSQQVQRAADAGALAGATFLPSDLASAQAVARDAVARNGYGPDGVTVELGDAPSKLEVVVTHTVENSFTRLFGVEQTTITRSSVAEFTGPVPLGSPINHLGNQPVDIDDGDEPWPSGVSDEASTNPQVWLNVAGPVNNKANGDRFASGRCGSADTPGDVGVWGCSATGTGTGTNEEHDPAGYYFNVRVDVRAEDLGKRLAIEVYDPAFVQTGDNCTDFGGDNTAIRNALAAIAPRYDSHNTTHNRTFCTGDHRIESVAYGTGFPTATFTSHRPDTTPWQVDDNPPVNVPGCNADPGVGTFRPYGTAAGETANALPSQVQTSGSYANRVFHKWVRICSATMPQLGIFAPGQYDIPVQVSTGAGAGHNRFAIRTALTTDSTVDSDRTSVFAFQHLPLYQNALAADSRFYLARVLPSGQDRILAIQMFDVGDGSGSGEITILPPPDSMPGDRFTDCSGQREPATYSATSADCTIPGVSSANFQAQRISINVPVPASYSCDVTDPLDCWVQVRFNWSSGVQDTTTWSAGILGDPVRLVE